MNKRKEILDEASKIVNGARTEVYGGPEDSFRTIGGLWSAYLGVPISTSDVALLLGLMKVARLKTTPTHHDSWVDIAGYAACGAECAIKPQSSECSTASWTALEEAVKYMAAHNEAVHAMKVTVS